MGAINHQKTSNQSCMLRPNVEFGRNVKEAQLGCHLVVQSSRFGYGPSSRALFDLGRVLGAVFSKGTETGSRFGIFLLVFVRRDENRKNKHVLKIGPEYPKRCSSIGGPRKTGFRPEIPKK